MEIMAGDSRRHGHQKATEACGSFAGYGYAPYCIVMHS